jgi:hypothetical protein
MADKRPPMPQNFSWYSICSRHGEYHEECGACNKGRWINQDYQELEQWLYRNSMKLWRQWANRAASKERSFLERIFPRLRK